MSSIAHIVNNPAKKLKIKWYRCPIDSKKLRELTKRSDAKGFFYTIGHLFLYAGTAYLVYHFLVNRIWVGMALALWAHGTMRSIGGSGFHEFSHGTVFKTKWLNGFFLRIWSALNFSNHQHYKMSHTFHHLNTLHIDGDGEVVLPRNYPLRIIGLIQLFTFGLFGWGKGNMRRGALDTILNQIRIAVTGKFRDEWSARIYTSEQILPLKRAVRWPRIVLLVHITVLVVSLLLGLWIIPIIFSLGSFIGNWYIYFVGGTMHSGLRDNVPDFRKCTRTIKLDPFSGFLRWNMHYHIEHHMFAAIPCYNLGKLYREVAHDMPKRRDLIEAWREMKMVEKRQKNDPSYQFDTPVPGPDDKSLERDPLGAEIGDIRPRDYAGQ